MCPSPKDQWDDDDLPEQPRKSRLGCLVFSVLTLIIIGTLGTTPLWLFPILREKGFLPEGLDLSTPSAPDLQTDLSRLRQHVADIQDRWQKMPDPDELRARLEGIHRQLIRQRDNVSSQARERWNEAIARSESLISRTKQNAEDLPRRLDELQALLRIVESLSKIGPDDDSDEPRAKPLEKPEAPDRKSALPSPDYQIGR